VDTGAKQMKIKIGVHEDIFKEPQAWHITIKEALIHRVRIGMTISAPKNCVLIVWDDDDNLLIAKNIDEELGARRNRFQTRCNRAFKNRLFDDEIYQSIEDQSYEELEQILKAGVRGMTRHYQFGDHSNWMKTPKDKYLTIGRAYFASRQSIIERYMFSNLILYVYEDEELIGMLDIEPYFRDAKNTYRSFGMIFEDVEAVLKELDELNSENNVNRLNIESPGTIEGI
jgi:hypothetical protein